VPAPCGVRWRAGSVVLREVLFARSVVSGKGDGTGEEADRWGIPGGMDRVRAMEIVSVVGARPQFVKAAVSRELRGDGPRRWCIRGSAMTMGDRAFSAMGRDTVAPRGSWVGSGSHGSQTGAMLRGIEVVLRGSAQTRFSSTAIRTQPLARAPSGVKLGVSVAHIEECLRSFSRQMPEGINRVVADHVSALLLWPSHTAVRDFAAKGISRKVHVVGDVMLNVLKWAKRRTRLRGGRSVGLFCARSGSLSRLASPGLLDFLRKADHLYDYGRPL
jgi:hypothetical protein